MIYFSNIALFGAVTVLILLIIPRASRARQPAADARLAAATAGSTNCLTKPSDCSNVRLREYALRNLVLRTSVSCAAMAVTCLIAIPSARAQEAHVTSPVDHGDDSGPSVEAARVVVRSAAEWLASVSGADRARRALTISAKI